MADGAAVLRHSDPYCYCCCLHVRRGEEYGPSLHRAVIFVWNGKANVHVKYNTILPVIDAGVVMVIV